MQLRADWRPRRGRCVYKVSIKGSLGTMIDIPIRFQLKGDYCLNVSRWLAKSKQILTKLWKLWKLSLSKEFEDFGKDETTIKVDQIITYLLIRWRDNLPFRQPEWGHNHPRPSVWHGPALQHYLLQWIRPDIPQPVTHTDNLNYITDPQRGVFLAIWQLLE